MTSWPDQPPQTRRQAREHQRALERELGNTDSGRVPVSRRAATATPTPAGEVPDVATPYSFASAQREEASERSAAPGDHPRLRPRTPRYDELSFDSLLAASHAGGTSAETDGEHAPSAVKYAPVDGAGSPATASERPTTFPAPPPVSYTPTTAPGQGSSQSAPVATSTAEEQPKLPTVSPIDGHPLTRRELRAMLRAQATDEAVAPETVQPSGRAASEDAGGAPVAALAQAAPPVSAARTTSSADAENDEDDGSTPASGLPADAPMPVSAVPVSAAPVSAVPAPVRSTRSGSPSNVAGASVPVVPEPTASTGAASTGAAEANLPTVAEPRVDSSAPATDPQLRARAAGHWSTMDSETQTGETPRSVVATGTVTTANALILPSIPSSGLANGPLTSTGEVIVTGSIELPKSLGATGQHPDHFDSSDIDHLFEESDAGPDTSSVAPVRASKAVATHTSTRGMITPPKARGDKLPVVLAVTAAVLVLGVVALVVAGYVFHAF